jgi:uncharacterized ParB-like nuclease family protein
MNPAQLLGSLKKDFFDLLLGRRGINVDAIVNPEKYAVCLSIDNVVADAKVTADGVENYEQKIANKEQLRPIIVVKHPSKERYAVLDGHHRYYAVKNSSKKEISAAVIGDYSRVMYYLTKNGYFQPSSQLTKNLRSPILQVHNNIKEFLENFAKQ